MAFRERIVDYIASNWGAPFVLAFIVLLIASAVSIGVGAQNLANAMALYAFYSLVLGVALQLASYLKYGEAGRKKKTTLPSLPKLGMRKRTFAIVVVVLIIVASLSTALYFIPKINPVTTQTTGKLKVGVNFLHATPGPSGSEQVIFGINSTGGVQPLNFTARWGDGFNESNNVGVFQRSFAYNESVPSYVVVVAKSANGETASVTVNIPQVSRTTSSQTSTSTQSTATSSTTTLHRVSFVESGLFVGQAWAVSFGPLSNFSDSSTISFSLPSGYYIYTVSEPFAANYSWAAVATPSTGLLVVNGSDVQIDVSYSIVHVTTPQDQLFNLTSGPLLISSNSGVALNMTFTNNFPVRINGIVIVMIRNSTTAELVQFKSATIAPSGGESDKISVLLSGLAPGNYTASVYVQDPNGATLSQITNKLVEVP